MNIRKQCPICSSSNLQKYEYDTEASICVSCGSLFSNYLPSVQELKSHYELDVPNYKKDTLPRIGSTDVLAQYSYSYLNNVLRATNFEELGKVRILDIGSSTTAFPSLLSEAGFGEVYSSEVFECNGAPGVTKVLLDLNDPDTWVTNSSKFDIITMFAVLEHLREPANAFRYFRAVTDLGAEIFIMIPVVSFIFDQYAFGLNRWHDPPGHLQVPSFESIESLALSHGFECVHSRFFEISRIRWMGRYLISIMENLLGLTLRTIGLSRLGNRLLTRRISASMGFYKFVRMS